jgi:hypothetical protein
VKGRDGLLVDGGISMNQPEGCPITTLYAIRSGIPLICLGILLILAGFLGYVVPGIPVTPFPVNLIFAAFGIFLIWAGLTK